jgi:hypothetical protein
LLMFDWENETPYTEAVQRWDCTHTWFH